VRARETHQPSDALHERLEKLLQGLLLPEKGIHHAIMAVERVDDSFSWIGAVGDARPEGTPMEVDTPFFVASVDKLFTATVIVMLHERGQIDLDETIVNYLPQALISGVHRLDGVDYTGTITVRHLLSHTSGLADWLEDRPKRGKSIAENLIQDGDRSWTVSEILRIVREQLAPHFPPQAVHWKRQKARYCDTNYILLVAIIEVVTCRPLHRVLHDLVFRPLALRHTWVAGHSEPSAPTPKPAALWAGSKRLEIPLFMRSVWGVYSTAEDTLAFLRALVRGAVFNEPGTVALMQQRWNRFRVPLNRLALRSPSWPIEYGLGLMRFDDPILKLLARLPSALMPIYPAPAVIGHSGSTGSWLFFCPRFDLLLSGTVDQARAGVVPYRLIPRILSAVDECLQRR
jgi:CubicO group peptidase (beta-lactamase class C family)